MTVTKTLDYYGKELIMTIIFCETGSSSKWYKTFYLLIVVSQNVCHWKSLAHQSSICKEGWNLTKWSHIRDSTIMVDYFLFTQILEQGRCDSQQQTPQLTIYTELITSIKSFVKQAPAANSIKLLFASYTSKYSSKLSLSISSLS